LQPHNATLGVFMKKWLVFLLLSFTGVWASDHVMDVSMTSGAKSYRDLSSFELDYRIVNDFAKSYILVNPRFKPLGNGNLNSGLGIGLRTDLDSGMLGFHLACDHSYISKSNHLQLVPSFEFLGSKWQYFLNGYLPVKSYQAKNEQIIQTHRYFDQEIIYKWRHANLSLSHNYDLDRSQHGLVGKVSKDFGPISLSVSGGRDGHHGNHVKVAITYSFPNAVKPDSHSRVNRHIGVVYDRQILSAKPLVLPDKPKPIAIPMTKVADPVIAPVVAPTEVPAPPPATGILPRWFDSLFSHRSV
jgi:hypothetical protein